MQKSKGLSLVPCPDSHPISHAAESHEIFKALSQKSKLAKITQINSWDKEPRCSNISALSSCKYESLRWSFKIKFTQYKI